MKRENFRPLAGALLILAGAAVLATALAGYLRGTAWQRQHAPDEDPVLALKGSHPETSRPGEPFARLLIPGIGLNVMVVEGTRKEDLLKGPGHLAGSAGPGAPDNCVIAGHRDLHFRRLGRLSRGDLIKLEAAGRESDYRVESVRVVSPGDTSMLAPSRDAILTLITCFPFRYVGPAPKRYIVRARLVGASRAIL